MRKDLLSASDLEPSDVEAIYSLADHLRAVPLSRALEGRAVALLFERPSTRTRVSFEVGVSQLGGHPVYLDYTTTQLSRGESVEDTARTLERYVSAIVARVSRHDTLERMAAAARIPVINALSDLEHPCQALSDYYTVREKLGRLRGVVLAFIGDSTNVFNSLALLGAILGVEVRIASPRGYGPSRTLISRVRDLGGDVLVYEDPEEAVRGADVVYTDVFISMGQESEREARLRAFLPRYRVTEELMSRTGKRSIFMHCLPAHRGEEVEDAVMDSESSVVFDQAGNRLHVQKAILVRLAEEGHLRRRPIGLGRPAAPPRGPRR
ncbi:MAG: ornithine carbamoyltransferase [Nitrososphaeria archaeon]